MSGVGVFPDGKKSSNALRYCGSPTFRTNSANRGSQGVEQEVSLQTYQQPIVFLIGFVKPLESLILASQIGIELSYRIRR